VEPKYPSKIEYQNSGCNQNKGCLQEDNDRKTYFSGQGSKNGQPQWIDGRTAHGTG